MQLHMIRPGDQETRMSEKEKKKKPVTNHFSQKEPFLFKIFVSFLYTLFLIRDNFNGFLMKDLRY
jgi:hypothetical protein